MLRKRGVRYWGMMIVSGTLMISVRLNQARWAQHLLDQAGVPIENPLPTREGRQGSQGRGSRTQRGQRSRRSRGGSELGAIADSVSDLLNSRLF